MAEILVVDDELGIRTVLSEILMDAGYYVTTAANASEARDLVKSRTFDLVLLDIWMPEISGLDLLHEWKARRCLTFPVVIMSGHATIDAAKQALNEGAVDFLEKPISLKKLLTTIQEAFTKWTAMQESITSAPNARGVQRSRTPIPRSRLPVFSIPEYNITLDFNKPFREALLDFERAYFLTVLGYVNHSVATLARHAGMERTHLYRKVRMLGINMEEYRAASRQGRDDSPLSFVQHTDEELVAIERQRQEQLTNGFTSEPSKTIFITSNNGSGSSCTLSTLSDSENKLDFYS